MRAAVQTESRGWEIEGAHHQHPLDDPSHKFVAKAEHARFWILIALVAAICVGTYLLGIWLEPPTVVFRAPTPPSFNEIHSFGSACVGTTTCTMTAGATTGNCTTGEYTNWTTNATGTR